MSQGKIPEPIQDHIEEQAQEDERVNEMRSEDTEKERVYIDHPDEAPSGVSVQEGQQGGLYYDPEEADEQTEDESDLVSEARSVRVDDWPEQHAIISAQDVQDKTAQNIDRYDEDIAEDFMEHFEGYEDKHPTSAWRFKKNDIALRGVADEETISHEMGHGVLGTYGVTVGDSANMFAHFFQGEVPNPEFGRPVPEIAEEMMEDLLDNPDAPEEKKEEARENLEEVKERYEGEILERGDMYLFVDTDEMDEEPPDEIIELAEEINRAWDKQIEAAKDEDADPSDYVIGNEYSSTNPHETMSMTHEVLMGDVADPHALENLWVRQDELLAAWTKLFEPRSVQADLLNALYEEYGPNEAFEEKPYPDHEGAYQ